jgi:polyhydroxyalkanoate synthesis regulator phasin
MSDFSVYNRLKELKSLQALLSEKVKYYSNNFKTLSEDEKSRLEEELASLKSRMLEQTALPERPKANISREDVEALSTQLRKMFDK